jgi:hypothetical protein
MMKPAIVKGERRNAPSVPNRKVWPTEKIYGYGSQFV